MAMQHQNGRNLGTPDENRPSWRPHDQQMYRGREDERWRERDEREEERGAMQRGGRGWMDERDEGYRSMEHGGYGPQGSMHRGQGFYGQEERRGGQGYWMDRPERGFGSGEMERGGYGYQGRQGVFGGPGYGSQGYYGGPGYMSQGMGPGYGGPGYGSQGYGSPYGGRGYGGQGYTGYGGQGFGQEHTGYGQGYGQDIGEQRFGQGYYGSGQRFGGMGQGQGYEQERGYGRGMSQGRGWGMERGGQRGKGPMGYTRSDERIREHVCEALSDDENLDASQIEVTVRNGEAILSGSVDERRAKRMAEDIVEHVPGVKDVQNQIKVTERKERGNPVGTQQVHKTEVENQSQTEKRPRA